MNYRKFPTIRGKNIMTLMSSNKQKKRTIWKHLVRPNYIIIPRPRTKLTKSLFILLSILFIGIILSIFPILFFNLTDSAPHGIYLRVPGKSTYGEYSVVRLPHSIYLDNGRIEPEGKQLIKMVRALPGDSFTIEPTKIRIDEKPSNFITYAYSFGHHSYDINSNPTLPHIPNGTYIVPHNSKLYINPPTGSFDSRYLGPIDDHYEIGRVILLFDFKYIHKFLNL